MAIKAPAPKDGDFVRELIPQGMHVARCYSMVHIGNVEWEYKGEKKISNKIRLTWELPNEMRVFKEENGEQPMVISKEYTLSMYEKANLRRDLESWRGKGFSNAEADDFDVTKLLGQPCLLNLVHVTKGDNTYCNVAGVNPLMKGMECPAQINDSFEFNYDDKFDNAWVKEQPDFIKSQIFSTPEYQSRMMTMEDKEQLNKIASEGFPKNVPTPAHTMDEIPVEEFEDEPPF
jgi:hypothetical protein